MVISTLGASGMVNVDDFTTSGSQLLSTFHVTVTTPPQRSGALPASLLHVALHPPVKEAVPIQLLNASSIS